MGDWLARPDIFCPCSMPALVQEQGVRGAAGVTGWQETSSSIERGNSLSSAPAAAAHRMRAHGA